LALPNGIPSHDAFRRVFMLLDPDAFEACFARWAQCLMGKVERELVAIDGKPVRRSYWPSGCRACASRQVEGAASLPAGLLLGLLLLRLLCLMMADSSPSRGSSNGMTAAGLVASERPDGSTLCCSSGLIFVLVFRSGNGDKSQGHHGG